ncbi:hypothetical protein Tco_0868790 [Tanacetum coccineum]
MGYSLRDLLKSLDCLHQVFSILTPYVVMMPNDHALRFHLGGGGSISSDSFLPSILLLVVIIVTVVIVVVTVILVVVVVAIIGIVVVVFVGGWEYAFHQDKASLVRVPVANVTLSSSTHLLRENTDSVRSNQRMRPTAPFVPLKYEGSSGTGSLPSGCGMIHNELSNSAKIDSSKGYSGGGVVDLKNRKNDLLMKLDDTGNVVIQQESQCL